MNDGYFLMSISESVIQQINDLLGVRGQPHVLLNDGQLVHTDCIEWKLSFTDDQPQEPEISLELTSVLNKIQQQVHGEFSDMSFKDLELYSKRIQELFKLESQRVQDELKSLTPALTELANYPTKVHQRRTRVFRKVRKLLLGQPFYAFWIRDTDILVVAPTLDQYEVLRYEYTNGSNYGFDTEDVINKLKSIDEEFGIDIIGAAFDGVDFILKRIPKGKEAKKLGEWLLEFCPELYEAPKSFPKGDVSLWWD